MQEKLKVKICSKCKIEKPLSEFWKNSRRKDGFYNQCKVCVSPAHKKYYNKNKKKIRILCKKYQERNPEKVRAWKRKSYYKHRDKRRQTYKQWAQSLKKKVMDYYGGKCVCCGETNIKFLTIDHINGRKINQQQTGCTLYRWIIKNNYPDDLQVLCWNCNVGRYINSGVCPHKDIYDGT